MVIGSMLYCNEQNLEEATMTTRKGVSRRQIIVGTTGAGAALATGILGFPAIGRAQADAIKIGHLTPRTGFLGVLGDYAVMAADMAAD
jgi:branched-chain amino acid transport system substrate-binding protein